ncbi:hypothetical protein [Otariodibacter sp.]|uniref:hypothetical protein n=1 Tax=Otariodibacter sp. TaxID=3030919 RepID=UPI0026325609|nr:hypothetical protein [Otariodibacter sp.]
MTNITNADIKWWEKTVEYKFVRNCTSSSMFLPLDGDPEKMGDTIFSEKNKFLLIEFKRIASDFKDEIKKYSNMDKIKQELNSNYPSTDYHIFIYGENNNNQLDIAIVPYWDGLDGNYSKKEILSDKNKFNNYVQNYGTKYSNFDKYVRSIYANKKSSSSEGDNSSGSFGLENISNCIVIVENEGKISAISLGEYAVEQNLTIKQEQKQAIDENKNSYTRPKKLGR